MAPPAKLYKYRQLDANTIHSIVSSVVYFARPDAFNDPFDCKLHPTNYEGTDEEYRAYFTKGLSSHHPSDNVAQQVDDLICRAVHRDERALDKRWEEVQSELNHDSGVFCLSADPAHILMWSHYADCHKGCCLEFSTGVGGFKSARRVNYPPSYPKHRFLDCVNNDQLLSDLTVYTKSKLWEYEQEWRISRMEGPKLYHYEQSALTGIIFGFYMKPEQRDMIRRLVEKRNPSVQLYEAVLWKREFKMQIRPALF